MVLDRVCSFQAEAGVVYKSRRVPNCFQEIEVIIEGQGCLGSEEEYAAKAGDMFWYYSDELITARADAKNPYRAVTFIFQSKLLPEKRPVFKSSWRSLDECVLFCERALRRYVLDECSDVISTCVFGRLYWEAMEYEKRKSRTRTDAVEKAITYIEEHYAYDVTVEDIARHVGVSAPHLHYLFKRKLSMTPMKAVLDYRLRKAETLLERTDLSIKEVSHECGFNGVNNFCQCFRRVKGISAGAFRRGMPD